MTQTNIPGTERTKNARAEHISEQLREQLVQNANGRAREKELRKQLLSELLGDNPEAKNLLEQLVALLDEKPPAYRYVDGQGIGIESILNFKLEAKVHPTGETPAAEEPKSPPPKRKPPAEKGFDEDSIPDADESDEETQQRDEDIASLGLIAVPVDGVEEDDEGDVVVPDKAAKKTKPKKATRRKK